MVEIIPSINASDFEEVKRKIAAVEPFTKWVHLDVSDGVFAKHISWHDPKDLIGFETKVKIEVHLMIDRPEKEIESWLATPAARIIFHQESTKSHQLLIEKIKKVKKKVGIAIKQATPWLKLFPYLDNVDVLELLAVPPGPSGQLFQEEILHKIGHIRSLCKKCIIEVDGGVNKEAAAACVREGANILVAGSAIFNSPDIKKAIKDLKNGISTRRKN